MTKKTKEENQLPPTVAGRVLRHVLRLIGWPFTQLCRDMKIERRREGWTVDPQITGSATAGRTRGAKPKVDFVLENMEHRSGTDGHLRGTELFVFLATTLQKRIAVRVGLRGSELTDRVSVAEPE